MLSLQIFTSLGVYSALSLHLRRITSLNFCPPETHCSLHVSHFCQILFSGQSLSHSSAQDLCNHIKENSRLEKDQVSSERKNIKMLNLFSLKQEKKEEGGGKGGVKKKASAAQLRITKDINELELPKTCRTEFPDPDDLLSFKLLISPDEV